MEEKIGLKSNLLPTIFFIFGFTVFFVILGVGAGSISSFVLKNKKTISVIGGVVILIVALYLIGAFNFLNLILPAIFKGYSVKPKSGTLVGAFILGLVLSAAWTPCVGPILSAILVMATTGESIARASIMLFMYSMGIGVPFLLGVAAYSKFVVFSDFMKKHYSGVKLISGIILGLVGLFLIMGQFQRISIVFASLPDISQAVRIENISLLVAFLGGIISFASPCVLPLVPTYISYITGVSVLQLENENSAGIIKGEK